MLCHLTQKIAGKHAFSWAEAHFILDFGSRILDLETKKIGT
jgi:hypothetical protein